jgi:hypothetical protein
MHGNPTLTCRGVWGDPRPDTIRVLIGARSSGQHLMEAMAQGARNAEARGCEFRLEVLRHARRLLISAPEGSLAQGRVIVGTVHNGKAGVAIEPRAFGTAHARW